MREVLETKLKEFLAGNYENREFKAWLRESNLWMALYSCLRIRGIEMDKKELVEVLNGKIVEDLPIEIYGFVHGYKDMFKEMQACIGMQESLSEKILGVFYDILIGGEGYRKDNPVIYKWNYIAPHFNEISLGLKELFRNYERESDPVKRAVLVHNGIVSIYPYGDDSPVMALSACFYVLMQYNIPLPSITVDDEDYDKLMHGYFSNGDEAFSEMLESSLLNRIDSVNIFALESMER